MVGGSGGGGTNVQRFEPWEPASKPLQRYISNLEGAVYNDGYQQSPFEQVAQFDPMQNQGMQMAVDRMYSGSPDYDAARRQTQLTAEGYFSNPYTTMQTQVANNPYMGDSPFYRDIVERGAAGIQDKYAKGTAAQTDASFSRAGAFGGSAYREATKDNQGALADQLGSYYNQMGNAQYDRSTNLAENAINRGLQAQQGDLSRATQGYENERSRMLQSVPLAMQGYGQDLNDANMLMTMGGQRQQQSQNLLNAANQQFQQYREYPYQQLDRLISGLGRSTGQMGGSIAQPQQQANPWTTAAGLGLATYGMFK